jgi:hypothetical protein
MRTRHTAFGHFKFLLASEAVLEFCLTRVKAIDAGRKPNLTQHPQICLRPNFNWIYWSAAGRLRIMAKPRMKSSRLEKLFPKLVLIGVIIWVVGALALGRARL